MNEEINKIINWIEMSYTRLNYKEELLLVNYNKQLQQENARLKEENQALLTLVNWFEECGMGFDNIVQDDIINWEKFEEETEDMGYIESMIYYAKKYNEKQNLKEN